MKFYNPFKPHIVTDGEKYAIRKFKLVIGWQYFDIHYLNYWWIRDYDLKYCWTRSEEKAKALLDQAKVCDCNSVRHPERRINDE